MRKAPRQQGADEEHELRRLSLALQKLLDPRHAIELEHQLSGLVQHSSVGVLEAYQAAAVLSALGLRVPETMSLLWACARTGLRLTDVGKAIAQMTGAKAAEAETGQ